MKLLMTALSLVEVILFIAIIICFFLNHENLGYLIIAIFCVLIVVTYLLEKYMWWSTLGW
jgi:energy-coupling factor transporter transmembrane protein EcfT